MAVPFQKPAAVDDVYQVSVFTSLFGQILINTFFWRTRVVTGEIYVGDIYQYLHSQLNDADRLYQAIAACSNNAANLYEARYQRISSTLSPQRIAADVRAINWNGSAGADPLCNTDGVVVRRGDPATRSSVGKVMINMPGIAANVVAGVLTQDYKALLDEVASQMKVSFESAGEFVLEPCIYNRMGAPKKYTDITQAFPMDTARVMTRRTVRRGI